ncbi:tyrosine--tRNA ligase [Neofamilia massiliensis]|uniref:tyrosine--tRNA ligase n=1 Tax=Neofamilia massiliensis TaxID=1673724 RepID=UPI0006BB8400|nr:tyrosine--tRNA ligase [Neofamilia massiliensis]
MNKVFETLKVRGYINNYSHDEVIEKLNNECLTFYIGFDATADSLTLGHFVTIMAMMHMEKAGHKPIALLGGGTTMIGDPSGRNDMRQIMTKERIDHNAEKFREQISRFLDVENGHTVIENNANWLLDLNFVNFMREVGVHFGVNQMLALDAYKNRLEDGLTFFEMSYILMQAYDFLVLNRKYGASLQMGGSDQWSNILAGVNLIRKTEEKDAYALTFNLLTTADGIKMGKTAKGAIWLDREKTSPYDMFQYLRNVADADVKPFLKLLTFLDLDEIEKLTNVEGAEINKAKEVLAYEVVKMVHGKEDADASLSAARSLFAGNKDSENIPTTEYQKSDFENGKEIIALIRDLGFVKSNGEGRRLIQNGGISLNDEKVADFNKKVTLDDFKDDKLLVRKGKKTYHQIKLV